ncbi:protein kinase [Streptomyces sp. NRRL S-87]|uniref:protein kinase n=1 Tax=Streptomyces sp. NRRL S-87 TaxID=1463920 RepID=UPI00055A5DB4|nr:protein kinase [Streptomyces sp. NRRL S-87]
MQEYAGRVLADRYRLPLPPSDEYDLVETRAFDTYSGQEVLVRQVPLPEVVDAELLDGETAADGPAHTGHGRTATPAPRGGSAGGATRRPVDPVVRRALEAAQAAARIPDHPRLDQVFDVFAEGGSLWIVSELVVARPLAALLADRPLSPYRAAEVAADVLTALRALHAHGWVHRNITMRTVLVCEDGRVVLTGLAAGAAEEALCGYDPVPPPDPDGAAHEGSGPDPGPADPPAGRATTQAPRPRYADEPGHLPSATAGSGRPTASPGAADEAVRRAAATGGAGRPPLPAPADPAGAPASTAPPYAGGPAGAAPPGGSDPSGAAAAYGAGPAATGDLQAAHRPPVAPGYGTPGGADLKAAARAGAVAAYRAGSRAAVTQRLAGTEPVRAQGSNVPEGYAYPYGGGPDTARPRTPGTPDALDAPARPALPSGDDALPSGADAPPDPAASGPADALPGAPTPAAALPGAPTPAAAPPDGSTGDAAPGSDGRAATWHGATPRNHPPTGGRPALPARPPLPEGYAPAVPDGADPAPQPPHPAHPAPGAPAPQGGTPRAPHHPAAPVPHHPAPRAPHHPAPPPGGPQPGASRTPAVPARPGPERSTSAPRSPQQPAGPVPPSPQGGWDRPGGPGRAGRGGPGTPLAAERARQTRIQVVGAVTERWAPEQAHPVHENWQLAAPVGPATDLWALGALLYRAVQGHAPYPEDSAAELVEMVCSEPPAFAEECGPLRPVVESLLRQDPTERPEFEELRGWLRSLVRSAPEPDGAGRTLPEPPPDAARLPIVRRRGELVRRRRAARERAKREQQQAKARARSEARSEAREEARAEVREEALARSRAQEEALARAEAEVRTHAPPPSSARHGRHRQPPPPKAKRQARPAGSSRPAGPRAPARAPGTGRPARALGRTLLLVVLVGLAGFVAYAMVFMPEAEPTAKDIESPGPAPTATAPSTAAPTTPGRTTSPTASPSRSPARPTTAPATDVGPGYTLDRDREGFQVAVPQGWQRRSLNDAGQVRFSDGDYELIVVPGRDPASGGAGDPLGYQRDKERELEPVRTSSWSTQTGVREITVGQRKTAEGQYTWTDGSGRSVYVRNRVYVLSGRYHILMVIGPDSGRDKVTEIYEHATASYKFAL